MNNQIEVDYPIEKIKWREHPLTYVILGCAATTVFIVVGTMISM